jgi:hypothetical protein
VKTKQGNTEEQYSEICKDWLMKHEDGTTEPELLWLLLHLLLDSWKGT